MEQSDQAPETIPVGAADKEMRLFRANAAVKHGEQRLAAQAVNRTGMETRATSMIGWSVPISLAAVALALNPQTAWIIYPALAVMLCFTVAATIACVVLWPRNWVVVGEPPASILTSRDESELEFQERIAGNYGKGVAENHEQLNSLGKLLKWAWVSMAAAAPAAAMVGWWFYPSPVLRTGVETLISLLGTLPLTSCS